ncbi:hypothetical protein KFE98_16070 [bacterium SCSIO 12741]|nr:hypothetical protein KFE98_16070 [bacterium SCSIO 12741]
MMYKKLWAIALVLLHAYQLFFPSILLAAHGNDSMGSPIGVSQMVDVKTGDFSYSIPLMDVEGYPVNLNYNAGIKLEQQASWVGLGWSLTPGAINRQMRGIPDDFKGDVVTTTFNQEDNLTRGGGLDVGVELSGAGDIPFSESSLGVGLGASASFNNYTGLGIDRSVSLSASVSQKLQAVPLGFGGGISMNQSVGNQSGVTNDFGATVGMSFGLGLGGIPVFGGVGLGRSSNYNSIRGYAVETSSIGVSMSVQSGDAAYGTSGAFNTVNFPSQALAFTPGTPLSRISKSFAFKISAGGEYYSTYPYVGVNYREVVDKLIGNTLENPGYGQMYLDQVPEVDEEMALLDFNREAEGVVRHETTVLPFSYNTDDVFMMSSAMGGMSFRTKRSDVGEFRNPVAIVEGNTSESEAEFGVGMYAEFGTNFSESKTFGVNTSWKEDFGLESDLKFSPKVDGSQYEPYYFKPAGELTQAPSMFQGFGYTGAVAFTLSPGGSHSPSTLLTNGTNAGPFRQPHREQRLTTVQAIEAGRAGDYSIFGGIIKDCNGFTQTGLQFNSIDKLDNTSQAGANKPHHISDFHIIQPNGSRLYFSHPVYNRVKKEYQFNVEGNGYEVAKGLVSYTAQDASTSNNKGVDHYFQKKDIPGYAEQFLISGVLSSDYEDRTQNGPSKDDIGQYTLFNYSLEETNYRWRYPYQKDSAYFDPGTRGKIQDDKGSFVYGEKELWYLQSIESKNMIAEFILNDELDPDKIRKDGLGVLGVHGGQDATQRRRYLQEIRLYSKEDKLKNGAQAQPLRTVVFHYSYDLCPGSPDSDASNGGKLTLESLEIFDFESLESKGKEYAFTYGFNPAYKVGAKDRWGNYMPNNALSFPINSNGYLSMTTRTNNEYPFTPQAESDANSYAAAWNLSTIETPGGSEIKVYYESDNYAYVQDRKPMRLFQVLGFKKGATGLIVNELYAARTPYQFMVVDLGDEGIPSNAADPDQEFRDRFLRDKGKLLPSIYYKFYVEMANGKSSTHDVVSGYANIDADHAKVYGPVQNGFYTKAIIPVKPESVPEGTFNPIARMAWQYAGDYLSKYVIPGSNLQGVGGFEAFVHALAGQQTQKRIHQQGFYKYMRSEGHGRRFNSFRSFVKLFDSDGIKYGGGHRVAKITVTDHWEDFSDTYGTEFTYADPESTTPLTSGVNSNEPMIGGEDNTLFRNHADLLSQYASSYGKTSKSFVETPMGRNVLPGAQVVYSYVEQKSIQKTGVSLSRTGSMVDEFYTSKDYPISYDFTPIQKYVEEADPKVGWNKRESKIDYVASQGFSVVLNDMHGKPKRKESRDENGKLVSSIEYKFRSQNNQLNNLVNTLDKWGNLQQEVAGIDVSICVDTRQNNVEVVSDQDQKNINVIPSPAIIPFPIPLITWMKYHSKSTEKLKTITLSKIVQQYGILEEVITYDERARFSAQDVLYDHESREAIASTSTNFLNTSRDHLNLRFPAYWFKEYQAFGPAYQMMGHSFTANSVSSDSIVDLRLKVPGTVCIAHDAVNDVNTKVWVSKDDDGTYKFIQTNGTHFTPSNPQDYVYEVVRPGQQNRTGATVQSFSLLKPTGMTQDEWFKQTTVESALAGSAITYIEDAQLYKKSLSSNSQCYFSSSEDEPIVNPFLVGVKGSWNIHEVFNMNTLREYQGGYGNNQPVSLNLETDGISSVIAKYSLTALGMEYEPSNDGWIKTLTHTRINALTGVTESKNASGNYSSKVFAHQGQINSGFAADARTNEVYVESFEDKNLENDGESCFEDRLIYSNGLWYDGTTRTNHTLDYSNAHTGAASLAVDPGEYIQLEIPELNDRFQAVDYQVPFLLTEPNLDQGIAWDPNDPKDYLISFWVKMDGNLAPFDASAMVTAKQGSVTKSLTKYYESTLIDGWKQLTYLLPRDQFIGSTGLWSIRFNNNWSSKIYLDDVKIAPVNAKVQSVTVSPLYGRQEAQLDPVNFSVQYIYNTKGVVSEIFRETSEGKVTISSMRNSIED